MKYLKKFNTDTERSNWLKSADWCQPNITYVGDTADIVYRDCAYGVYIQHINGTLYTVTQWKNSNFTNDDANGVAVFFNLSYLRRMVMAKNSFVGPWSSNNIVVPGVKCYESTSGSTSGVEVSTRDYSGKDNTKYIADVDQNSAAYTCYHYIFPNGKRGYLPAQGELSWLVSRRNDINVALEAIGADYKLTSDFRFWSSSQNSRYNAFYGTGYQVDAWMTDTKTDNYRFFPVTEF